MPDFVEDYARAFESQDPDRILDLFRDDVRLHAESLDQPIQGKDALRGMLQEALRAIGDVSVDVRRTVRQGNEAASLVRARVAFSDDVELAGATIPTGGKTARVDAALFVTLDDEGRAREVTRIRDNWQVMRELGMTAQEMEDLVRRAQEAMGQARAGRGVERRPA